MYYLPFILLIKLFYAGAWLIEKPVNSEGQSHNSYAMTDNLFESFEDYAYDKYKVGYSILTVIVMILIILTFVQLFSEQINLDNQMDNLPGGGYPIFINYVSNVSSMCSTGTCITNIYVSPLSILYNSINDVLMDSQAL